MYRKKKSVLLDGLQDYIVIDTADKLYGAQTQQRTKTQRIPQSHGAQLKQYG